MCYFSLSLFLQSLSPGNCGLCSKSIQFATRFAEMEFSHPALVIPRLFQSMRALWLNPPPFLFLFFYLSFWHIATTARCLCGTDLFLTLINLTIGVKLYGYGEAIRQKKKKTSISESRDYLTSCTCLFRILKKDKKITWTSKKVTS